MEMEIIDKKNMIPKCRKDNTNWLPLYKKAAALVDDTAIEIKVKKSHQVRSIKLALEKEFKYNTFNVSQRKVNGGFIVYVTKGDK